MSGSGGKRLYWCQSRDEIGLSNIEMTAEKRAKKNCEEYSFIACSYLDEDIFLILHSPWGLIADKRLNC